MASGVWRVTLQEMWVNSNAFTRYKQLAKRIKTAA